MKRRRSIDVETIYELTVVERKWVNYNTSELTVLDGANQRVALPFRFPGGEYYTKASTRCDRFFLSKRKYHPSAKYGRGTTDIYDADKKKMFRATHPIAINLDGIPEQYYLNTGYHSDIINELGFGIAINTGYILDSQEDLTIALIKLK